MKNFSAEDAANSINNFCIPVDEGVRDSLINFMLVADRLNVVTFESCHGHVDWVHPYPSILFEAVNTHKKERRIPFWNIRRRYQNHKNEKWIEMALEKRAEDIIFFLTREIISFHEENKTEPKLLFFVMRTGRFCFRVIPVFQNHSRGLRKAGMFEELENLMIEQRKVLKSLSEYILRKVESISSLDGESRCDCDVCLTAD